MKPSVVPFQYGPNGCVDFCRWTEIDRMKVTGWAFDATPGQRIKRIEVYYNGILRGACELSHYRPDVAAFLGHSDRAEAVRSGWDCWIDLQGEKLNPEQDWLFVKAGSTNGKEFVLRLDHPANIDDFNQQGWTYTASKHHPGSIISAIKFVEQPVNGRFTTADSSITGWIAANDESSLVGLALRGRFGTVPFSSVERPDVVQAFPGFFAMGFHADLPLEYLTVLDPKLRFVSESDDVVAFLDVSSEPSAIASIRGLTAIS